MSLTRIGQKNYVMRASQEIDSNNRRVHDKTLEVLLLENLKGIADVDYYRDSDFNTTTYIIYLKKDMDYSMFEE